MHSTLVRLQNVFGFFTTVAFTVACVVALSSFIAPQAPNASVALRNIQVVKGRPHYYSYKREEYAHLRFDLDADLTSLFNWNTKQVFLYIKAIYPSTTTEPASEAVIWDAILPGAAAPWDQRHFVHPDPKAKSKENTKGPSRLPKVSKKKAAELAKGKAQQKPASPFPAGELHLRTQRPKYQITDIEGKLQNRTGAVLEIGWNIQPWVGALTWTNWQTVGVWKGLEGGRSEPFTFPQIGKKTVVDKKELETEKGTEGYRLEVGQEQAKRAAAARG